MSSEKVRRPLRQITAPAIAFVATLAATMGYSPADAQELGEGTEPTISFASYDASATAEGVRFTVGAPGFAAVETFIDGGGPVAQSLVDGLGNSRAFASLPYPGDLAITGPGLLAGLTGLPSPPSYPFYVSSSYPTAEEATLTQPGYELVAKSRESASESSATSGGNSGDSAVMFVQAKTSALRDTSTGEVIAEAAAKADVINIGGVLKIVSGAAHAKAVRSTTGELQRESSFVIEGVSIADQTVGFGAAGFLMPGSAEPLPDDSPLAQALTQAGITVKYLKPIEHDNGVVSPGLVVTHQFQFPGGGPNMIFTYVFGRASAYASVGGA